MYALLSVHDKTGIVELGRKLSDLNYKLLSTGGTARVLEDDGLEVIQVGDFTEAPEALGGRVKTLHPKIHAGILAQRSSETHKLDMERYGYSGIGVVAVNFYPFKQVSQKTSSSFDEVIENIDIGGPTMVRAAAKNFQDVVVLVSPSDYLMVKPALSGDDEGLQQRQALARTAFKYVTKYDRAISFFLDHTKLKPKVKHSSSVAIDGTKQDGRQKHKPPSQNLDKSSLLALIQSDPASGYQFPIPIGKTRQEDELRYGENPHQRAFLYRDTRGVGIANATQIQGGEMSYLNYLDADAAWGAVTAFDEVRGAGCVIVKHASPCGMAVNASQTEAFKAAFACDKTSAYGGIIGFNYELTTDTAMAMKGLLLDVIVAPSYETGALEILKRRKRARILTVKKSSVNCAPQIRSISGGALIQELDNFKTLETKWQITSVSDYSKKIHLTLANEDSHAHSIDVRTLIQEPNSSQKMDAKRQIIPKFNQSDIGPELWDDLKFAWLCCRYVKSNAVVLVKGGATIGIGGGQPNRVKCVELAVKQAGEQARGAVMASDAFFPFADGVELAARAGVKAVIHPGGSIRDEEVIEVANKYGMAMVLTGERHFLH